MVTQPQAFVKDSEKHENDVFDSDYYITLKRVLSINGQWPYQTKIQKIILSMISLLVFFSFALPEMAMAAGAFEYDTTLFIECMAVSFTTWGCLLKWGNTMFASEKLKRIFDEIRFDWANTTHEIERKILREFAMEGKLAANRYLTAVAATVVTWISAPMLPKILDIVHPLNETRPQFELYHMDYKAVFNIDGQNHEHLAYFHGAFACASGIIMLVATDALYLTISKHICGLIRILRYRLERIGEDDVSLEYDFFKPNIGEDICYRQIVGCVETHRRIVHVVRLMEATNEWILFLVLAVSIMVIPCISVQAVNPELSKQNAARFALFAVTSVLHLYCNTLPGHWITCESERIHDSSYDVKWYVTSRRCRALIVIALRRTATPCTVAAGKLWVMSMENFCAVMRMTMSYFTMLSST